MKPASHLPVFVRKSYRYGQSAGRCRSIKLVAMLLAFAELTSVIFSLPCNEVDGGGALPGRRSGISISTWLRVIYEH
jgi:hypothetical protein